MIEAKIGELLPPAKETTRLTGGDRHTPEGKSRRVLPEGITHKTAYRARAIHAHPEAVAEVIREAETAQNVCKSPLLGYGPPRDRGATGLLERNISQNT